MSQITHTEARTLINFNADEPLELPAQTTLKAHLDECPECRRYAQEINEIEGVLKRIWQKWPVPSPLQLRVDQIAHQNKGPLFRFSRELTTTGVAIMAVMLMAAITFGALRHSNISISSSIKPYTVIPIPTPSSYLTSTKATTLSCEYVVYQVQANDTLDHIASKFSVSKQTIMEANGMKEEKVEANTQIKIPVCSHTPTTTIDSPSTIITNSPQFEVFTLTPA